MEPDRGKLFIGGISWETDEQRLKDYFSGYGDVVWAVIMRDRVTGRGRGFGFVVFADPADAERVIMEKHIIAGRIVEAKRAVPRDNQQLLSRNISSYHSSPAHRQIKKIFVGGLPSGINESDFKKYFDHFGIITDVVVMRDHNTQRPRGFGFITFDSEDAANKAVQKAFRELNGKMVEVKKAVPKELYPTPNRSPLPGYNDNFSSTKSDTFVNKFPQGYYDLNSLGESDHRMDNRFRALSQFSGSSAAHHKLGMDFNHSSSLCDSRMLNPYDIGTLPDRLTFPISYDAGGSNFFSSSINRDLWVGRNLNGAAIYSPPNVHLNSGMRRLEFSLGNNESFWHYGRSNGAGAGDLGLSFPGSADYGSSIADRYQTGSTNGDSKWQFLSSDLYGSAHSSGY